MSGYSTYDLLDVRYDCEAGKCYPLRLVVNALEVQQHPSYQSYQLLDSSSRKERPTLPRVERPRGARRLAGQIEKSELLRHDF